MKLVSCHIRNFGTLSNKDYSFKNGINSFIEDNGMGKSTLAAFIKAMLYGMDSIRTTDTEFKDRRHYAPFNEQSYGGTLVFEHEQKEYRIERTFDVKSSTKDVLNIYVDKVETTFDKEIGEVILGLDKESFERLLFINSKDIRMESNGNIRKNLNNIIDDTTEGVDFDSTINQLDEIIKKYSGKKTSVTYELKEKKKQLESQIANQEVISNALGEKYERRNQLHDELVILEKKQSEISEQNAVLECWNTYNNMLSSIKTKKDKLVELESKYPKGYPTDEEIMRLRNLFESRTTLLGASKAITFDESKLPRLNALKEKYSNGTPTQEDMTYFGTLIPEYSRVKTLSTANEVQLSEEENSVLTRFKDKDVDGDYNKVQTLVDEYKTIDDSLKITPQLEESIATKTNRISMSVIISLICAFLILCVGIAMFFVLFVLGIVFTVIGAIGLFVTGFLYLKTRIDMTGIKNVRPNDGFAKLESSLRSKAEEIHQILTPYGIYTQSVYSDFEKFKGEVNRYKEIVRKQTESKQSEQQTKEVLSNLEQEINNFLTKYVAFDDFMSGYQKLKDELNEYQTLSEAYDKYRKAYDDNDQNIKLVNLSIKLISDKYDLGLLDGKYTLEGISSDVLTINKVKQDIINEEEIARKYKEEKQLGDEPSELDECDYSEQIKSLTSEILILDNQIDNDERDIENLEDNRQALLDIKETIKHHEHKYDVLTKLKNELYNSQKSLDDKYVAPIMEKFDYYSNLLGNLLGVKVEMGRDFNIILNINGQLRSDEHLSSGQRSICALCFRLALLDNIYGGSIPFIVMDDPFMPLDKNNLKFTSEMLKALSTGKQIIYFACHPSRSI